MKNGDGLRRDAGRGDDVLVQRPRVTFGHFTAKSWLSFARLRATAPSTHSQLLGPWPTARAGRAASPACPLLLALPARLSHPLSRLRRKRKQISLNEVALKTNRPNCRRS